MKTSHGGQTAEMLQQIEGILFQEKPDAVLVYGDTNSTLAGALAAVKIQIPVIHVEAGLRSYNKEIPEEINRIMTDHVSTLLFCSSPNGILNLQSEGITKGVFDCGDLMKDALILLQHRLQDSVKEKYIFATFHRPYNIDRIERLTQILDILNNLSVKVIFPLHPRTRKAINSNNLKLSDYKNIRFINPVGYIDSLRFQKYSDCVITDSGGIQKEAYWLKRKCITIRSETEWIETLKGSWNELIFDHLPFIGSALRNTPIESEYQTSLYGEGDASGQVSKTIFTFLKSLKK